MSKGAEDLLKEALALPEEDRAGLAAGLLDSLAPGLTSEQRSDEAWIAEVERRARAAVAGAPGVSWDDARSQVKERLASR